MKEKNLTPEEIANLIQETQHRLETESFDKVFGYAADLISEHPDCYQLIWQMAAVLDAGCFPEENPDFQKYEKQIEKWYIQTLDDSDRTIRQGAADSLFHFYFRNDNYKEAEKYLQFFPEESTERKIRQAQIYSKTNRRKEAYKAYEEILFSEYQKLDMVMQSLMWLSVEDSSLEQGEMWREKDSALAALFDMGKYRMNACRLELAVHEKDIGQTFLIAQALLDSVETIGAFSESKMYTHMEFKKMDQKHYTKIREGLLNAFRNQESLHYMEQHEGWKKLIG